MGGNKRSAVGFKSGNPVANSGPVLRRPTPPNTSELNPQACSTHPPQPQSWPGRGAGSPAGRRGREAAPIEAETSAIDQLLSLLKLLDDWDRSEAHGSESK
jgi:hypothetical protein